MNARRRLVKILSAIITLGFLIGNFGAVLPVLAGAPANPNYYTLTVSVTGSGNGTVTSNPAGINCPGDCSESYLSGASVTLTALAASESIFSGWSSACSDTGSCMVSMTAAKSVTATFTANPNYYALTVSVTGTGNGTVISDPVGITCPGDCSESYLSGASVTLTALAASESIFSGWSGACSGDGSCVVSMNSPQSVSSMFIATSDGPDLIIESISVSPPNPVPDQNATYTVRVRNQGTASISTSFYVDLFVDNVPIRNCEGRGSNSSWFVASLSAGAYQDLTTTMALSTGTHSLYAHADTYCSIAESNENNNILGPIDVKVFTPYLMLTVRSIGLYDGYVWESTETSGMGLNLKNSDPTFQLGDDNQDRQYRAILSFDTSALPDNAVIMKVTLKIRQWGNPVGTNPFSILGGLKVDIRKPYFGSSLNLLASDFQAGANTSGIGTFGSMPVSSWRPWYSAILSNTAFPFINLTGTTQFRLRFSVDDNDNMSADYMRFLSGDYWTVNVHPTLIIEYHLP